MRKLGGDAASIAKALDVEGCDLLITIGAALRPHRRNRVALRSAAMSWRTASRGSGTQAPPSVGRRDAGGCAAARRSGLCVMVDAGGLQAMDRMRAERRAKGRSISRLRARSHPASHCRNVLWSESRAHG